MMIFLGAIAAAAAGPGTVAGYELTQEDGLTSAKQAGAHMTHMWVDHGELVHEDGSRSLVGNKASNLQMLIDALPPAKPLANVTALVNGTQLRRLRLTGAYVADQTLHLPSLFVLALDPGTTYRGSAAGLPDPVPCPAWQPPGQPCPPRPADGNSMIQLNGTYYSAITGGHFDCADLPRTYHGSAAISAWKCSSFVLRGATLSNCGLGNNWSSGNIGVAHGSHGEIAHSKIYGGSRSIWTQYETGLAVHHNEIHGMWDADGHSGPNNLCYSNVFSLDAAHGITNQPAIWMEAETTRLFAWNNSIFNASIALQGASGAGHVFVGNHIANSTRGPLLMGCEPGCPQGGAAPGDMFASNTVTGNRSFFGIGHQGNFANNWMFDNNFEGDEPGHWVPAYMQQYTTYAISIFDPRDASSSAKQAGAHMTHMWVDHGELVHEDGSRSLVGNKASNLQMLIDALPPAKPLANVTALVNGTQLRRLRLTGAYVGDTTLHLPSLFVLALDPGTTYRGSAAGLPGDGINNLVQANGTYYTAIVGGHFDCSDVPRRYYPVTGLFGGHVRSFTVTNTTVSNCGIGSNYSSGNVMVQNGDHGEVAHTEIYGGSRGIWTQNVRSLAVHHNHVHDTSGPIFDADHGNVGTLVFSNLFENLASAYSMWVELDSTGCFFFNNTIKNTSFPFVTVSGAGHWIVGNHLINNTKGSFVFGDRMATGLGDVFAGNIIEGNSSVFSPGSQGSVSANWVFGNEWRGSTAARVWARYLELPASAISIFDP